MNRQLAVRALRKSGALQTVERVRFLKKVADNASANKAFVRQHPGVALPPRWVTYDASGDVDYAGYWRTGLARADFLAKLAAEHLDGPTTVYDWGCGPGRIVRHLVDRPEFSRLIASDYNRSMVAWDAAHILGVDFRVNGLEPPLPVEAGSVDMIYSFSVLTHLSEPMLEAWMVEQRRVVRPGGLILATTHGDRFRHKLLPDEQHVYDSTGVVARGSVKEGSRVFATFTSPAYIRRLADGLEVIRHDTGLPSDITSGQDLWLFRA